MKMVWLTFPVLISVMLFPLLQAADEEKPIQAKVVGTLELEKATRLAVTKVNAYLILRNHVGPPVNYRVISVQNLLNKGPEVWLVSFKPENLIPANPEKEAIGLGGEIFITVNVKSNTTTMTYGE